MQITLKNRKQAEVRQFANKNNQVIQRVQTRKQNTIENQEIITLNKGSVKTDG